MTMTKANRRIFFYFFLIACLAQPILCNEEPFQRVIHSTDPEAKCLDGTPPVLYIHQGLEKSKFLVFFFGGGECTGLTVDDAIEDCYRRSKTQMGSSSINWPETLEGAGYLSTDPSKNRFANWTKIALGYCDGSFHQGYRKNPISYKGTSLYFRGAAITRSHFKWLSLHHNFAEASQVVITGSSAGGVASYIWTNYVLKLVKNPTKVSTIADSSMVVNFTRYETGDDYMSRRAINNFKLANIDEKSPLDLCNLKYKDQEYKCLFFEYAWTSLQAKTMVVNSEYDGIAINDTLGIRCLTEGSSGETLDKCSKDQLAYIERYHDRWRDVMEYFTMVSRHSAWTIGCSHHGYTFDDQFYNSNNQRVPAATGPTLKQAIEGFVFEDERVIAMEVQNWPANKGCAY